MARFLTDPQFDALTAVCDTLLPAISPPPDATEALADYYRLTASALGVPAELARAVHSYATPEGQRQLKQLLSLLSSPVGNGLLTGHFWRFAELPFEMRENILQRWAVSRLGLLRQGFQAFKRLSHALFFSMLEEIAGEVTNPTWAAIDYSGPDLENPLQPKTITTHTITGATTLDCDVVVVGSGAGGGVVAGELAQAGHKVIVLEKGNYYNESDFARYEYTAFRDMYEKAGNLTTEDLGVVVLAGKTLGGGTTINWAGAFRTPAMVLHEWATEHGLLKMSGSEYQAALDAVCRRAHVNIDESHRNPQNEVLYRGAAKLGYHNAPVPRNVKGCQDCGRCSFGCIHGAKQSTLKTWLQDAHDAGAEFVVGCHVERVLIENRNAVGVAARVTDAHGVEHALTVRARAVVVAAGSIHSPAILLRSGIDNPNIGKNLRLHPTTSVRGEFPHKIETWRGVGMAIYSDEFADLDDNYGVRLETPSAHPGLLAFGMPWQSARQYKDLMAQVSKQAFIIVLTHDRDSGRVVLDKAGRPRLHYKLSRYDRKHMLSGMEGALRVLVAAGAVEIGTLQSGLPAFDPQDNGDAAFEAYIRDMWREGAAANRIGLFSAHQMGTCRMGRERAHSVVNAEGESWDVNNLFVADASTFPTSSGSNPMITIQAIAYTVAQYMKTRL